MSDPDMPVRWGVLSTASINGRVIAAAHSSDRARFVAVASRTRDTADAFARAHGLDRAHSSYAALLADPEIEAVYISAPNSLHIDLTMNALDAGKHVLCEKPLSRDPADVERAFDLAAERGLVLTEAFMYRHHPQTATLARLVADGAIGRPFHIRAALTFAMADPDADIRASAELDGGALMDVGSYCVNAARMIAGADPHRVFAERLCNTRDVDVQLAGTMRFAKGLFAQFDCGLLHPRRDHLEVSGTEGTLIVADPWHCRTPGITLRRDWSTDQIPVPPGDPYRLEIEEASQAIRTGRPSLLRVAEAIGQARTLAALHRSAVDAFPVTLDSPA